MTITYNESSLMPHVHINHSKHLIANKPMSESIYSIRKFDALFCSENTIRETDHDLLHWKIH